MRYRCRLPRRFSGAIAGLGAGDALDLGDIAFGSDGYAGLWADAAGTDGTLTLSAAKPLAVSPPASGPGQNVHIPCSAFARHAYGWKVLAPVRLDIDGRMFGPMVGTMLAVASATNGGPLNEVLDRECGNR